MNDPAVMVFLTDQGARAGWVASVCAGRPVAAEAGLVKGHDATAHRAGTDLFRMKGARHVEQRVITDRNRMTGSGGTAGIDLGLLLLHTGNFVVILDAARCP